MDSIYPTPTEVGIYPPKRLIKKLFNECFEHAMQGNHITEIKHLKLSFRQGYRSAKLYLREVRKQRGNHSLPLQGKIIFRVA